MSEKTPSGYLEQAYDMLGQEIKELLQLYDAMETEQNHVNNVVTALRSEMNTVPVMPNSPNIIQEATKEIKWRKTEMGNLKYAIMKMHGMNNEKLDGICRANSAQEINVIMDEVLGLKSRT